MGTINWGIWNVLRYIPPHDSQYRVVWKDRTAHIGCIKADVWWDALVHPIAARGSSIWGDWARGTLSQHSTWPPWPLGHSGHKMNTTRRWPLVSNSKQLSYMAGHITNIFSDNSTWWLFEDNTDLWSWANWRGRLEGEWCKPEYQKGTGPMMSWRGGEVGKVRRWLLWGGQRAGARAFSEVGGGSRG